MSAVEASGAAEPFQPGLGLRLRHFASQNTLFIIGAVIFLGVVICAIFAPLIAPYDPTAINFPHKLRAPGLEHLMGTDVLGRDIFSRVVYGARISLLIGVSVLTVAFLRQSDHSRERKVAGARVGTQLGRHPLRPGTA